MGIVAIILTGELRRVESERDAIVRCEWLQQAELIALCWWRPWLLLLVHVDVDVAVAAANG